MSNVKKTAKKKALMLDRSLTVGKLPLPLGRFYTTVGYTGDIRNSRYDILYMDVTQRQTKVKPVVYCPICGSRKGFVLSNTASNYSKVRVNEIFDIYRGVCDGCGLSTHLCPSMTDARESLIELWRTLGKAMTMNSPANAKNAKSSAAPLKDLKNIFSFLGGGDDNNSGGTNETATTQAAHTPANKKATSQAQKKAAKKV